MVIVPVGARPDEATSEALSFPARAARAVRGRGRALAAAHPTLLLLPLFVVLLLAALALPSREGDEAGYLELARNLVDGQYASGRPDALLDDDPSYPDLWFGPGLPLVLAVPVALDLPLSLVRMVGPLFLFLALVVLFQLFRRYVRAGTALVATWALALYLPFYSVLPNLHSEPLAVLCVAVALYAIARTTEEGSGRWLVVGSAALALLALTRVAYGWVLTLMLLGLLVWWVVSRSHQARRLGAMVGLALALCVPWLAYTASETGRFFQWGNSGSLSLYWMSSPHPNDLGDWRQANQVFTDEALAPHRPFFETLRGLPLPEQNARLEREALANIVGHPLQYATNVAANVSRLLFDAPYSGMPQRLTALGFALPNALLLGLALVAGVVAVRVRSQLPSAALPFALFAGCALVLHALVAGYPRMLLPVVPVVAWFTVAVVANRVRIAETAQGHG